MRIAPSFQEQRRAITEIKPGNGVNQILKRLTPIRATIGEGKDLYSESDAIHPVNNTGSQPTA